MRGCGSGSTAARNERREMFIGWLLSTRSDTERDL